MRASRLDSKTNCLPLASTERCRYKSRSRRAASRAAATAGTSALRAIRLEVGLFTSMLDQVYSVARDNVPGICDDLAAAATPRGKTIPEIRNFMLGEGFRRMKPELWSGFLRHRAQVERFYHKAVEDFDQLKARRDEPDEDLRNEPNSGAHAEETEPLPPTENEPKNGPENEPEGPPPCPAAPECPPERPPVPNPPSPTPEHQPVAFSPRPDSSTPSLPPAVRCSHRSAPSVSSRPVVRTPRPCHPGPRRTGRANAARSTGPCSPHSSGAKLVGA
jgi:hypothetical protein